MFVCIQISSTVNNVFQSFWLKILCSKMRCRFVFMTNISSVFFLFFSPSCLIGLDHENLLHHRPRNTVWYRRLHCTLIFVQCVLDNFRCNYVLTTKKIHMNMNLSPSNSFWFICEQMCCKSILQTHFRDFWWKNWD